MNKVRATGFVSLVVIFGLLYSTQAHSQQQVLKVPKSCASPTEKVINVQKGDPTEPKTIWYVMSDRENNPVYSLAGSNSPLRHLGFGEKLAVLDIQGNRLQVTYKKNISKGFFPGGESFFIEQDNVLMWSSCLLSLPYLFDKKAMVLNVWREGDVQALTQKPKYYDRPSVTEGVMVAEAGTYQIRYVYKELKDFVLVGKERSFSYNDKSDSTIVGWVPTSHITPWDHRVAWELNWFEQAANERQWTDASTSKKRGALIFDSIDAVDAYNRVQNPSNIGQFQKVAYSETPLYDARQPGTFDRFPVLKGAEEMNQDFDIHATQRVGVIGRIETKKGEIDKQKWIDLQKDVIDIEDNQTKINVIFVIDATFSMEQYADPVATALDSAMTFINRDQENKKKKNTFKFGAVLYRDQLEDFPVHVFGKELSDDHKKLGEWLSSYMTDKYYGKDPDLPEAVYYGIDNAINAYTPNSKQTNYIIVIGDAGDHQNPNNKTWIEESKLIKKLASRRINLLAYQVHRPDKIEKDTTYKEFEKQMKRLMIGTAAELQKSAKNLRNQTNLAITDTVEILPLAWNVFRLSSNSIVKGVLKTSSPNDSITEDTLRVEVTKNIKRIHSLINEKINEIANMITNDSLTTGSEAAASIIYDLLARKTSIADIEKVISTKRQIYKEGYTVFQKKGSEFPNFQNVIFIEQTDLNSLKEIIRQLVQATDENIPANIIRNNVEKTVVEIFSAYVGDLSPDEIKEKPFGELLFLLTGLPTKEKYRNWTINMIKDPAEIMDEDISEFAQDVRQTLDYLTKIVEEGDDYQSIIQDITSSDLYYWIPGDVFPHDDKTDDVGAGF